MKITAGLGSIDDYPAYVMAGADEVFAGFVPEEWMRGNGLFMPLNRREVCHINVQLGSESELKILAAMMRTYKVPVTLTFNALYYRPDHYPVIEKIMRRCLELGYENFIVADMALLVYLKEQGLSEKVGLHVSGETGEINHLTVGFLKTLGIKRVIFHRKVTIDEIAEIIRMNPEPAYEAFALNENCHFNGGYCNSLHCDEMPHICHLPYKLGGYDKEINARSLKMTGDEEMTGSSGCGLCALWALKEAGITYLKVVGRGNYADAMAEDIAAMRKALDILEQSENEEDYIKRMKLKLLPEGCSHNCYYKTGR